MNKKGQVFLIAAIIFIFAVYSVIIKYNTAKEYAALEDYEEITENYQSEFPKVVNKALYKEDETVESALEKFNKKFLSNARQKDPNYGVLYAYKDARGNLHIVNTLNKKVINIEFSDPRIGGRVKEAKIIGDGITSEGQICLSNIGCSTSSTEVDIKFGENYGRGYDIPGDVDTLIIEVPTTNPRTGQISTLPIELDIKEFTTMNYISSEDTLKTPEGDDIPFVSATLTTT